MKKVLSILLAVLLVFSLCSTAMAATISPKATPGNYTESLLSELAKTKKFYAHVTGHSYENRNDMTNFDFYDDFNTSQISLNFKSKGIQAIYDGGAVKCVFVPFFCYVSATTKTVPLIGTAVLAVESFQSILKQFINDPMLGSFNKTVTTVERHGKTVTSEHFKGRLIPVSGTFYYDADGSLCEIILTDTVGASIGFTVDKVATTFDSSTFKVPAYYFDLSILWKILVSFLKVLIPVL